MNAKLWPVGVEPRFFHDENRMLALRDAIHRYNARCLPIPPEWIEEYNELLEKQNKF